ncbi:hypothetical protein PAAG_11119 [Paracoccidioides lutzii Pb01]|uniref:Uncharacterized protein n=1 Tax=Paracoccidioides lutzii (strain ATCC MYA-826 / Pb01) TaxID=502779 RepID=A0A0A2VMX6_PARBA|nr:hypothetical protein PAAG_11119 [Paracoccidioides lutzii Pb01]KGQ02164.1 hypothetical protein PAAG_11119 [Paracoccidioides lutzii Pb01]
MLLEEEVKGICTLVDHSNLLTRELRIAKSEAELRNVRKAGYLADFSRSNSQASEAGRLQGRVIYDKNLLALSTKAVGMIRQMKTFLSPGTRRFLHGTRPERTRLIDNSPSNLLLLMNTAIAL